MYIEDRAFTQSATDTIYYIDSNGMDSVVVHIINFQPTYTNVEKRTIKYGESVTWRGHTYSPRATTTYRDTLQSTVSGCDSILALEVTVKMPPIEQETITICQGETITINGKKFYETTVYRDTLYSTTGIDKIHEYIINVTPKYIFRDTLRVDRKLAPIEWRGQSISATGLYSDSHKTIYGCDSIYEVFVKFVSTYLYVTDTTVCQNELPFKWRGKSYSEEGTWSDVYRSVDDGDSIYQLKLHINPSYKYVQQLDLCAGSAITYHGVTYTRDTIAYDSLLTSTGCDSIIKIVVTTHQSFVQYDTIEISNQETIEWHGQQIWQSGNYTDYHTSSVTGCDSVYHLNVTVYPVYIFVKDTAICQTEMPFIWHERGGRECSGIIGETVTYEDQFTTVGGTHGIDSIYRLNLTVYPAYEQRQSIGLCEGEWRFINGKLYENLRTNEIYRDTVILRSEQNCDSIIYYEIFQYPTKLHSETRILHVGETIEWNGQTITSGGTYTDVQKQAANGCDSISELVVIAEHADTAMICALDTPYVWRGKEYRTAGDWTDTVRNELGRITEFHSLNLTMQIPIDTTVFLRGCQGFGVHFNNVTYLADTAFIDTLSCDTIYRVFVKIDSIQEITLNDTVCEIDLPYIIGTQAPDTIWSDGNFTHEEFTPDSCIMTKYNITLTIIPDIKKTDSIIVCERFFQEGGEIILGDTVSPWFDTKDGGRFKDLWRDQWKGVSFTEDTIVWNCDSTHFFHIIVRPEQRKDSVYKLCEGDSIQFGLMEDGITWRWIKTAGIYEDTIPSIAHWTDEQHGGEYFLDTLRCDSIIRLTVEILPAYKDTIEKHIPMGDSLYWGGTYYHYTGVYDSIADLDYTDSRDSACHFIHTVKLFVDSTYHYFDTIDVCETADKTLWHVWEDGHRQRFTVPDKDSTLHYFDSLSTRAYHFDSIYDLYVHYHTVPITYMDAQICEGDSMRWGLSKSHIERFISKAGNYADTLVNPKNGCDSIVILHLNVYPKYLNHKDIHITDKDSMYVWTHRQIVNCEVIEHKSDTLRAEGEYAFHYTNEHGCDSIDSISLHIHKSYLFKDSIIICQDKTPYQWFDKEDIYTSGWYTKHFRTSDGYADSIYMRYIEVLPVLFKTISYTICEGDFYTFGDKALTRAGVYTDTLVSSYGCDSIVTLNLTVAKHYHNTIVEHLIEGQGQTVEFYDMTYTDQDAGVYQHQGEPTSDGCDSITELRLIVHPAFDTVAVVCAQNLPFRWVNKWSKKTSLLYEAGIYRDDTTYVNGERMFFGIKLEVNYSTDTVLYRQICEGGEYNFNGQKLTRSGEYRDTLVNAYGCDSIITLHLNVQKGYYNTIERTIYEGDTVHFENNVYSRPGNYPFRYTTDLGCDSVIELQLTVLKLYDDSVSVCFHDLPYEWHGQSVYASGIYRDTIIDSNGKKVPTGIMVTVLPTAFADEPIVANICEGGKYNFNGRFLTESGMYYDTLTAANGCDSIVMLSLQVNKTYYHTVSRTIYEGDTVHFENNVYSEAGNYPFRYTTDLGCDSVIELRLITKRLYDDSVSICSNDLPYEWRDRIIHESGIYRDTTYADGVEVITGIKVTVLPIAHKPEPIIQTICEGDFYQFGSRTLTEQGSYYDTLTAANGCDSIIMLALQVLPVTNQVEHKTIFEGDSILFHETWYRTPGIFTYTEKTVNNCTNTYQLVLNVLKEFKKDTFVYVCDNELPFIWRGIEYYETGEYARPTSWTDSSRVVTTLHLTVNPTYYGEQHVDLCSNAGSYFYRGKEYKETGIFYDTIPSNSGCDSIFKIIVRVHPTKVKYDTVHLAGEQGYLFDGIWRTKEGLYEATYPTEYGCDSIVYLQLYVHPSYFFETNEEICEKDTFFWRDKKFTRDTVYFDSLLSVYGHDSVYKLTLTVHKSHYIKEYVEICPNRTTYLHGLNISQPGIYLDTLQTRYGCDSIYEIIVNWTRSFTEEFSETICQGESYLFHGIPYSKSGTYKHIQGCDSTSILHLTVLPRDIEEKRVVITSEDMPFRYRGNLYEEGGLFSDTLHNIYGCDSIFRLNLIVTEHYSDWNQIPLCPGGKIKIDSLVITKSGQYTFLRRSTLGGPLDSLYRVEVYDAPAYDMPVDTFIICQGDTLHFAGHDITRSGIYNYSLKTVEGCDSLMHAVVKVNPSYQYFTDATITDYQTYTWRDREYTQSGQYDLSWPTTEDCDSTYSLRLTVVETKRIHMEDTICMNGKYVWRGDTLTEDGFYTDTVCQLGTHTSAIYSLHLVVLAPTKLKSAKVADVCADAEFLEVGFNYAGAEPFRYTLLFDQLAKNQGFEDVVNATFNNDLIARAKMPRFQNIVYQEHTYYVRPDYYHVRLVFNNGYCEQSQSDTLTFLVRYPNWILEQNWGDVVAPLGTLYNGGYDFSQTEWYINGTRVTTNGLGYLHEDNLREGDEVYMLATRRGENYAVPTCPLIITRAPFDVYTTPVLVQPTQAPRHAPIVTIEAPQEGQYAIYSTTGMFIGNGPVEEGKTTVTLPAVSGIYFIRVTQGKETSSHKVVVY